MQNYHFCHAVERAVQTFLALENCNILGMNGLKDCLGQTFLGKAQNHHLFHSIQKMLRKHFCVLEPWYTIQQPYFSSSSYHFSYTTSNTPKTTTTKKLRLTCRPKNGSSNSGWVVFMALKSLRNKGKSNQKAYV